MDHLFQSSKPKSKSREKSPDNPVQPSTKTKIKNIGQFILGDKIGEGTFGVVRLGTHLLTSEKVAIKILERKRILEEADKTRIEREIKIQKCLRHHNIIQLYSVIQTATSIYLIMEFASGKELFNHIASNKCLKEEEACRLFQQIIAGIEYLHKLRIVHRDLKPENLLLDYKRNIKIVDFGLSNLYHKGEMLNTACGSLAYAAPEMISGKKYDCCKVDIWSSGIILFAMLCGYLPFEDQNQEVLSKKIIGGQFNIPQFISEQAKSLLRAIVNTDPEKRLSIRHIKEHPWFSFITPQVNLNEGLLINYHVIPIDEDIVEQMLDYGFNKEDIRTKILTNRHNHITTTYYLLLKIKTKKGGSSVSDLISEEFNEYIKDSRNLFSNYNCDYYQVINERSKSNKKVHHDDKADANDDGNDEHKVITTAYKTIVKSISPGITLTSETYRHHDTISFPLKDGLPIKKKNTAYSQVPPPKKRPVYPIPKMINKTPEPLSKYSTHYNKARQFHDKTTYATKALNYKKINYLPTDAIDTLHLNIQTDHYITNKEDKSSAVIDLSNLHSARNPQQKLNITNSNSPQKNGEYIKMKPIKNYIPYNPNKMLQYKRNNQQNQHKQFFNTTMSFDKDPDIKNSTFDHNTNPNPTASQPKEDDSTSIQPLNNSQKPLTRNEANYLKKKSVNKKFDIIKEEEEYANLSLIKKVPNSDQCISSNKTRTETNQDLIDKPLLNYYTKHQTNQYTSNSSRTNQKDQVSSYVKISKQYSLNAKHQKHKSDHVSPNNNIPTTNGYCNAYRLKIQKHNSIDSHKKTMKDFLSNHQQKATPTSKPKPQRKAKAKENMKCDIASELNEHKGPMDISCVSFKTVQLLKEDIMKALTNNKIMFKYSVSNMNKLVCDSNGIKFDIDIRRSSEIENSHFVKFKKNEGDNEEYRLIAKSLLAQIL